MTPFFCSQSPVISPLKEGTLTMEERGGKLSNRGDDKTLFYVDYAKTLCLITALPEVG